MVQNVSTAVMQRRVEADDSLDDFPTPSWATRAAIDVLAGLWEKYFWPSVNIWDASVREPCANRGYMVRPLAEAFRRVIASDVNDYGCGYPLLDYLSPGAMEPANIVFMNPPFNLAADFILKSFETPNWMATAVIVRTSFLEGSGRYRRLFSVRPPTLIAQHVERVIMTKGIVRDPAKEYWDEVAGKMKRPSTATSYSWLFWVGDEKPHAFHWIAPCRKEMERPGDYPEAA